MSAELEASITATIQDNVAMSNRTLQRSCASYGSFCDPRKDVCCGRYQCLFNADFGANVCHLGQKKRAQLRLRSRRSFNGSDNNEGAAASSILRRKGAAAYPGDGSGTTTRQFPNPREISHKILRQTRQTPNKRGLSDYIWVFGQFLE